MSDEATKTAQATPQADNGAQKQSAPTETKVADQGVKATEAKGEAGKPEASAKPETQTKEAPKEVKPTVPEKYELSLSKDSLLDPAHIEKVAEFAKQNGLTNEKAQEILDRENGVVSTFVEAQREKLKAQVEGWVEQTKSDQELGGAKFKENMEQAKRVVERYSTPEFMKFLNDSGLGNHPDMVRVFYRISKAAAEDKLVFAGSEGVGGRRDPAEVLYGRK